MTLELPDFMTSGIAVAQWPPPERQELTPESPSEALEGDFIAASEDAPLPPPPPFVAGIFDDMEAEHYHRVEAMSSGGVKEMLRSPQHFRLMRTTRRTPTAGMRFGTAVHAGVLEPETFDGLIAVSPDFNLRSKAGKAEAAEFYAAHSGQIFLSAAEMVRARRCIDAVLEHPSARKLLEGAEIEKSFFWNDAKYGVPCKARWDARNHGLAIDLKTTSDYASPEEFPRTVAKYLYHSQAAHYCSAAEHLLDASPEAFIFIAVETAPPFAVGCYALPGNAILAGAHLVNKALGRYAEALNAGAWPGYPQTIEAIQLPKWALRFD